MNIAVLDLATETAKLLADLGVDARSYTGGTLSVTSPITGKEIGKLKEHSVADAKAAIDAAHKAFLEWRAVPAPKRGELVRLLGEELRASKVALGRLVSIEVGKITSEGLGEVQEMIDICDFAVGLSRQLYGLTIATERAEHRMMESWHPLGAIGIISAFNFPVAVWSWNAALALVCGNSTVWKPSEKTPLTALAVQALFEKALKRFVAEGGKAPANLSTLLIGGREIGEVLVDHPKIPLVSATGSTAMGRAVGPRLSQRFARAILELGGNNAAIVCPTADLDLTLRGVAFAAMGTAGQRCTTLRRLFVHESVYDQLVPRLKKAYGSVTIGNPLETGTLVGPLIDGQAFEKMQTALGQARLPVAPSSVVSVSTMVRQKPSMFAPRSSKCGSRPARWSTKPSRRSCTSSSTAISMPCWNCTTLSHRACRPRSSPTICAKRKPSSPRVARIAESPTSISVHPVLKSAEPLAGRKRRAAAVNPDRTPGRLTCAVPPTPSITARPCRWRRASSSTSNKLTHWNHKSDASPASLFFDEIRIYSLRR